MARWLYTALRALLRLYFSFRRGLHLGSGVKFNGVALIDIRRGASVHIGDNVTLNSRNRGYHANMFSPVKLFADRPGARITIGEGSRLHGTCVHAFESISIGKRCLIAANCQLIDGDGHDPSFPDVERRIATTGRSQPITIEDDVWIGLGAIILPGVTIGRGAVIGAGSIVTKDVPAFAVAAGNPARVLKQHQPPKREAAPVDIRQHIDKSSRRTTAAQRTSIRR